MCAPFVNFYVHNYTPVFNLCQLFEMYKYKFLKIFFAYIMQIMHNQCINQYKYKNE